MKRRQRQRQILELLQADSELGVDDACTRLGASPATIRREFAQLAAEGRVEKTWGGVRLKTSDASPAEALRQKIAAQEEEMKRLRRELDQLRMKSASASTADAASSAVEVKGIKVLTQRVDGLDKGQMRTLVDNLRAKLGSGVVVLGAAADSKVSLIVGVTKDLTARAHAGKIVGQLAALVGGKGGGRPDLAEAGGSDVSALDGTLSKAPSIIDALI